MNAVGYLLHDKGSAIWTTRPDATVLDALKLMAEKNIGAVLVMEEDALVGILSERDYRHLPVLGDDDRVIGVISIGDVGKAIIAHLEFTIAHLEHYITGVEATFYRSS
jgi:predicted transcriptional regulator